MHKPYRFAFVTQHSSHNFEALRDICEDIKFCTTGYECEEKIVPTIQMALHSFNPDRDILVPVGRAPVNCLLGVIVGLNGGYFNMAIWQDKEYHIQKIWIKIKENNND